jgi:hypothetical protein
VIISKTVQAKIALFFIIIFGALLRFSNLNWDEGQHLHPDERYISLVLMDVRLPSSVSEYFSFENSLSPFNTQYSSYIYGQLPLTAIKYLSVKFGFDSYDRAYILGRTVSVIIDTASILLVFLLGRRLFNLRAGIFASLAYASIPLAIQNSHFMTMESWQTFFWLAAILMMLPKKYFQTDWRRQLGGGILLGMALATKANSIYLAGLLLVWGGILSLPVSVLTFRFFQPTIFSSVSWLDWSLRPEFRRAFELQQEAINGTVMFPPQWQWMETTPVIFLIKNLGLWGLGPAISVLLIIGIAVSVYKIIKRRDIRLASLLLFALVVIGYNGIKFVKTMRYAIPLLGILAVFAGYGADWLIEKFKIYGRILMVGIFIVVMLWAIMFTSIYRNPQTRIMASKWIYSNIPAGEKVMLEEWDDPLPLLLPDYAVNQYKTEMVGVYAPDDEFKKKQINRWLNDFEWIILSSPRAKGSIGRLPEQFPLMSRFYRDLENGNLGFMKVAEFTSFPLLSVSGLRLTINDSSAEESFWVYDHPKVEIYKKL